MWIPIRPTVSLKRHTNCLQCNADITLLRANKFCSVVCRAVYNDQKNRPQSVNVVTPSIGVRRHWEEILVLFKSGKTLAEIGAKYGVTRERIRQILIMCGASTEAGGAAVRAEQRRSSIYKQKNATYLQKHGVSWEEYKALAALRDASGRPLRRLFAYQRRNAANRGIEWKLSYPEWVKFWQESGLLEQRGRSADQYCMARLNDDGPYALGNIYISTLAANSQKGIERARDGSHSSELLRCIRPMGGCANVAAHLGLPTKSMTRLCSVGRLPKKWTSNGMLEQLSRHPKSPFTADQWEKFTKPIVQEPKP